jgi:hypothetical protein
MELLTPVFLRNRGWVVNEASFPVLDVTISSSRPLRMKLDCQDWDEQPPAAFLLEESGQPLASQVPGGIFHAGPHPNRPGPFICMRGYREYHTHSNHLTDVWSTYRGQDGNNIVGLLDQVSRAWRRTYGQ